LIDKTKTPAAPGSIPFKPQLIARILAVLIGGLLTLHFDQASARSAAVYPDRMDRGASTTSDTIDTGTIEYGVYDPASLLRGSARFDVDHIFVPGRRTILL
jgi:hypothetical protein